MFDIAIIGGGPAGLSAAIYALRAGKTVALFEGNALGGTLNEIKKMENYPAFKSVSGKTLAKKMSDQVMALKPEIIRQFVIKVNSDGEGSFDIYTYTDEYKAKRVIYCGGSKRKTIRAAEFYSGEGVSYCATCDGFFYRGKTVAVVGSGYVAEEDVDYLLPLCKKVYLIGKLAGKEVEQYDTEITKIEGADSVTAIHLKNGKVLEVDGLFIALGGVGEAEIFDEPLPIEGIFRAGDVCSAFKQVVWACAEGAKAATEAIKSLAKK